MNIMCILIVQFTINTYGYAYFNLGTYPDWAGGQGIGNSTTMAFSNTTEAWDVGNLTSGAVPNTTQTMLTTALL